MLSGNDINNVIIGFVELFALRLTCVIDQAHVCIAHTVSTPFCGHGWQEDGAF